MEILYTARVCRIDLLFPVCALAHDNTKWCAACDKKLHRQICYMYSTPNKVSDNYISDKAEDLTLLLYSDADLAGDITTSRSTSGAYLVLARRHTWAPLSSFYRSQSVVSHSSTQAETVALDMALRNEGIPFLSFREYFFGTCGTRFVRLRCGGCKHCLLSQIVGCVSCSRPAER